MKKTSTFKSPEITSLSRNQSSPATPESGIGTEFEPEARVVEYLLHYSKAVTVKESAMVGEIITLHN